MRCATPFALNLFHVRLIPSYPLFKKINCRAADDSLCIATSMDTNIGCVPSRFSSGLSRVHSDWYFCTPLWIVSGQAAVIAFLLEGAVRGNH